MISKVKSQSINSPGVKSASPNKLKPAQAKADADEYAEDTFEANPIDEDDAGLLTVESSSKPSKQKPQPLAI